MKERGNEGTVKLVFSGIEAGSSETESTRLQEAVKAAVENAEQLEKKNGILNKFAKARGIIAIIGDQVGEVSTNRFPVVRTFIQIVLVASCSCIVQFRSGALHGSEWLKKVIACSLFLCRRAGTEWKPGKPLPNLRKNWISYGQFLLRSMC